MKNYLSQKINIGISACQFGCSVRYNNKGWDMLKNLKREKAEFIWHPVCPEVMSGLGVPRSPISLKNGNGDDFWKGISHIKDRENKNRDVQVKSGSEKCFSLLKNVGIDVFIYMEGSPSCGVYRTTLKNKRLGNPPGIFGSLLLREKIFLIPSNDLQSPIRWWDWRRRMYAFIWLKYLEIDTINELREMWHTLKFISQELSRVESDKIGKILADTKNVSKGEIENIRLQILNLLRIPSSLEKIKHSLWKNYTYIRKNKGIVIEEVKEPNDIRNMTNLANELIKLEIASKKEEFLFGSSPIYLKN